MIADATGYAVCEGAIFTHFYSHNIWTILVSLITPEKPVAKLRVQSIW